MKSLFWRRLIQCAVILAFIVVVLGAYTRLTQAGLGCPDWPGCYGHLVPLGTPADVANTSLNPAGELRKAWTEMIHRYAAGALASIIMLLALNALIGALQGRKSEYTRGLAYFLGLLVIFQAALGMWTVTLKLLPIIVMLHLLGGVLIFSCLNVLRLQMSFRLLQEKNRLRVSPMWTWAAGIAVVIVFFQIALGGWVSANYAGTACIGFPQCNGQWVPTLHLSQEFNLFSAVGENYQGGLLDSTVRASIQFIHRVGALITLLYLSGFSFFILKFVNDKRVRDLTITALILIIVQFILGIINVIYFLPLWNAVAHNGVAALLLAVVMMIFYLIGMRSHAS